MFPAVGYLCETMTQRAFNVWTFPEVHMREKLISVIDAAVHTGTVCCDTVVLITTIVTILQKQTPLANLSTTRKSILKGWLDTEIN